MTMVRSPRDPQHGGDVGAGARQVAGEQLGQRPPAFVEHHHGAVGDDRVGAAEGHEVLVADAGGRLIAGGDQSPAGALDDQQPFGHDAQGRPGSAGPPLELHVEVDGCSPMGVTTACRPLQGIGARWR